MREERGAHFPMTIQGISSSFLTSPLAAPTSVTSTQGSPSSIPPPMQGGSSTSSISSPAQLFSQLQQLSQSDPALFKTVASQLATSFQNAASQASGPAAKFLTNLSNMFTQ